VDRRGIDRDDQVHVRHQGRGIGHVMYSRRKIRNMGLRSGKLCGSRPQLQREHVRAFDTEEWFQQWERN
jgi:hypothetical protein